MKKLTVLAVLLLSVLGLRAQDEGKALADVKVKTLDGTTISILEAVKNEGKPVVISFWATWCKPCIQELMAIDEEFATWQQESGVKLIAVSIDDARNSSKVKPFVDARGWEYTVLLDENSDLKRSLGVVNVPHTFVIDGSGNIVWQHNSYQPGDEEHLKEVLDAVAAGKPIE